jgi:hypothetical protein
VSRSPEQELGDLQEYDDLCARIYADADLDPGTRELAQAMAWLQLRDPARHGPEESFLSRVGRLLGRDQLGRWRHRELFSKDAPRYEPPRPMWSSYRACEGPRVRPYRRRGDPPPPPSPGPLVCGANGQVRVPERDLVTGQITRVHWFCSRHAEHADRVQAQIARAGEPPPPLPNAGGRLPRYFKPEGLIKVYEWARPGWKPPFHGICADDWVLDGTPVLIPKRPRLALVGTEAIDRGRASG